MFKAKERCVEAQSEEVISYCERQGYRENIIKGERAWDFAERKNKGIWGSAYNPDSLRDDYERELFLESS